jgi:hypothetical protein
MRNKKNKNYICNDSFGRRINVGDTVELMMGIEMHSSWISKVYWNMIDGAFVDAHPGHRKMGLGVHRSLRDFLNREDIKISNQDGGIETVKTYCKKIKTRV